jgi:hypothetical protein
MARNTRPNSYDEQTAYDEQQAGSFEQDTSSPEFMAYGSTPSMAKRDYFLPEDIPLFLTNDPEVPSPRSFGSGFGSGGDRRFDRSVIWSRVLKASFLTASAAAIAFAVVSVDNPLALFANAKASLIGMPTVQSGTAPKAASEPVVAARPAAAQPTLPSPSAVDVAALPPAAKPAPTRDEIALALRAAHQNQPDNRPQPMAVPPPRRLEAGELATLLKRANGLIAIGDIAPARLLLERAADAQEAGAALLLAQTYDPAVLGTPDARSITPDPAKARDWYRKAAQFGSQDAQQRLSQLQN